MKIAIGGKGGTGKTTVAGTLARALARAGREVVCFDADSSPNLAAMLGFRRERVPEVDTLPGDLLVRVEEGGETRRVLTRSPAEVVEDYAEVGPDGVRLLVGARVGHAGAG